MVPQPRIPLTERRHAELVSLCNAVRFIDRAKTAHLRHEILAGALSRLGISIPHLEEALKAELDLHAI